MRIRECATLFMYARLMRRKCLRTWPCECLRIWLRKWPRKCLRKWLSIIVMLEWGAEQIGWSRVPNACMSKRTLRRMSHSSPPLRMCCRRELGPPRCDTPYLDAYADLPAYLDAIS